MRTSTKTTNDELKEERSGGIFGEAKATMTDKVRMRRERTMAKRAKRQKAGGADGHDADHAEDDKQTTSLFFFAGKPTAAAAAPPATTSTSTSSSKPKIMSNNQVVEVPSAEAIAALPQTQRLSAMLAESGLVKGAKRRSTLSARLADLWIFKDPAELEAVEQEAANASASASRMSRVGFGGLGARMSRVTSKMTSRVSAWNTGLGEMSVRSAMKTASKKASSKKGVSFGGRATMVESRLTSMFTMKRGESWAERRQRESKREGTNQKTNDSAAEGVEPMSA